MFANVCANMFALSASVSYISELVVNVGILKLLFVPVMRFAMRQTDPSLLFAVSVLQYSCQ